jgi:hypothetical protein
MIGQNAWLARRVMMLWTTIPINAPTTYGRDGPGMSIPGSKHAIHTIHTHDRRHKT